MDSLSNLSNVMDNAKVCWDGLMVKLEKSGV